MNDSVKMLTALVRLRSALQEARFPVDVPGAPGVRSSVAEMIDQLEDYVIPRLTASDAPLLAVVGGSTGAGKSTLVNTLAGAHVTEPGLLRPTTRSPVLVHHPGEAHWFGQDRIFPDLSRTEQAGDDPYALQLVAADTVPEGLAILDAPDVDSVDHVNRALAGQMLAAADLWLFVTSAARYADQMPWQFLQRAADRTAAVAIVLDRTPDEAVDTVSTHLARMMAARGLKDSPLFVVREGTPEDGLLPADLVADIRGWLRSLAEDTEASEAVIRQTLDGTIRTLSRQVYDVADALGDQAAALHRLRMEVSAAWRDARSGAQLATSDGTVLSGEVLARWEDLVGGELAANPGESRDRGRMVTAVREKPRQVELLTDALRPAVARLVAEHARSAAERVARTGPGADLVGDRSGSDGDLSSRIEDQIEGWQRAMTEVVRAEGVGSSSRALAYGVEGLAVATMVVACTRPPGADAPGVGVPGRPTDSDGRPEARALPGERLLEAEFGDEATRRLVDRARRDLDERVATLMGAEEQRQLSAVDALGVDPDTEGRVREAARRVTDQRLATQQPPHGDHSA